MIAKTEVRGWKTGNTERGTGINESAAAAGWAGTLPRWLIPTPMPKDLMPSYSIDLIGGGGAAAWTSGLGRTDDGSSRKSNNSVFTWRARIELQWR
jgi:hypothetical protein